ncbi:MAG: hypothetical protein GY898_16390 [Proteobacteria bacterium]|nr:hypothetical protein [Pseudomonadota bacterium]
MDRTDFAPIPIRYNPFFGSLMLVAGLFIAGVGTFIGNPISMGMGVFHIAIAIAFLVQPWFVVRPGCIGIKNLPGMTLKSHDFESLDDFEVRGSKLYWVESGKPVKGVGGFLVHGSDWRRLASAVRGL